MLKLKSVVKKAKYLPMLLFVQAQWALADKVEMPDFINKVEAEDLEKAGGELQKWIVVLMALAIVVGVAMAAWSFFFGETEEGKKKAMAVVYGAVIFAVLGGLAVGFIELFN